MAEISQGEIPASFGLPAAVILLMDAVRENAAWFLLLPLPFVIGALSSFARFSSAELSVFAAALSLATVPAYAVVVFDAKDRSRLQADPDRLPLRRLVLDRTIFMLALNAVLWTGLFVGASL